MSSITKFLVSFTLGFPFSLPIPFFLCQYMHNVHLTAEWKPPLLSNIHAKICRFGMHATWDFTPCKILCIMCAYACIQGGNCFLPFLLWNWADSWHCTGFLSLMWYPQQEGGWAIGAKYLDWDWSSETRQLFKCFCCSISNSEFISSRSKMQH